MAGEWKDDRLAIRALRERWAIPADKLPAVIAKVLAVAEDPLASPRDVTAAMKALIAAEKLKLQAMETEMKLEEHQDLIDRLKRLEGTGGERGTESPG
jgi:hypothetical protein